MLFWLHFAGQAAKLRAINKASICKNSELNQHVTKFEYYKNTAAILVSGSSGRTRSRFTEIMLPQSPIFTSTPYNIGVAWFDLHDSKKHLINKQLKTEDTKKLIKKKRSYS